MKYKNYILLFFLTISFQTYAQKEISLDDVWKNNAFGSKVVSGINSMNDGLHYTILQNVGKDQLIIKYSYNTGLPVDTLFKTANLIGSNKQLPKIESYKFSHNENLILCSTEEEKIYRHSFKSNYVVYNTASKEWTPVSTQGKQQLASLSPDGKYIAFVRDNNLFIVNLGAKIESQITNDGVKNKVINGASDWVYEEEFAFDKAYEWSIDSKKIAFYRFDETEVNEYSMPLYGALYPINSTFKYPKAGEKNAIVKILMYDLENKKTTQADIGNELDQYIPRIKWTAHQNILSCQRLNRLQNKLDLLLIDASNGTSKVILTENSKTYIEVTNDLTFLKDNKGFIWSSELGGFNHLFLYGLDGKLINQITKGDWEIIAYKGYDERMQTLYFTAAYTSSINKEVCKIKIDGTDFKVISEQKGYNEPNFSASFNYFINAYNNAETPTEYALFDNQGKKLRVIEENASLKLKLKEKSLSKKEFSVFTTADGTALNTWMIKPMNFDENKKYPVIFVIYGGPGRNTVVNSWEGASYMWHQYLAQKGYIVVSVDNRGTRYKGEKFKKSTYGNLGMHETNDQIEVAKYLGTLGYVDKSRIGIQGWSFGGYLSSLCITKGSDVFKAAIAVAPVTNWRYYDSIYTERFLGLPKDNAKGYDDNSPINFVEQLKGNYLLIHGSADDNVHFQNSVEMAASLQKANKQFDFMMYPDKNHGISGGNTRLHIYTLMTDFILEKL
jgi:dipeptidyl-peptidase-4